LAGARPVCPAMITDVDLFDGKRAIVVPVRAFEPAVHAA
jgi:hypothetical protein